MLSPPFIFLFLPLCLIGRCSGLLPRPDLKTLLRGGASGGRRRRRVLGPVESCSWVQMIRGWTLCVALSRAIWFLTVLGPFVLPLDEMLYEELNSMDDVLKTVALYALPYLFSLCHVTYTCCRESSSDTSASVVRWWRLMCF